MTIFESKTAFRGPQQNIFHELINNWRPASDVLLLKHADKIIATMTGINGILINQMFRRELKLHYKGFISSSLFLSLSPAVATYISNKYFITEKILEFQYTCTTCHEMKAILFCYGTGFVHPLIIAPLINIAIAGSIGYRIPYLSEVGELTKLWWSVVRPRSKTISLILLFNSLITGSLVHFQIQSMEKIIDAVVNFNYKDNEVIHERNYYSQVIEHILSE